MFLQRGSMPSLAIWCVMGTLALLLMGPRQAEAGTQYTVTDLGTIDDIYRSVGTDINASGQVAGWVGSPTNSVFGFRWSDGTLTNLGTLGGGFSDGEGISDAGQVVGFSATAAGATHAFLWSDGMMRDLGTFGGTTSYAYGINSLNQVVGEANTPNDRQTHAFLWQNGVMTDLGTLPGGTLSVGLRINDSGQVVGYSNSAASNQHAVLWNNGVITDLGTLPGGSVSFAYGINHSGLVVGSSEINPSHNYHAFLYDNAGMHDLGSLAGPSGYSLALGINDRGLVVGSSTYVPGGSDQHAFLSSDGTMIDLNSQISPDSGWTLLSANGINDEGQIVGTGLNSENQIRAFLLTPIPEPPSVVLLGIGTSYLLGYIWLRQK